MSRNEAAPCTAKTRKFVGGSEQCPARHPPPMPSTRVRIHLPRQWSMPDSNPGEFAKCSPIYALSNYQVAMAIPCASPIYGSCMVFLSWDGGWVRENSRGARRFGGAHASESREGRETRAQVRGGYGAGTPLCATLPSHLGAGRAGVNRARGSIMRAWARGGAPRPSRWSDHLADRDRLPDRLRSRCWCAPWPTACRSRCRGRGTGSRHVGRRKDAKPPPPRLLRLPPMVAEAEAER